MRGQLKVGEIVIIQNDPAITDDPDLHRLNGEEVEVIGAPRYEVFGSMVVFCYRVHHATYGPFYAMHHELRRRRPPTTGEAVIRAMFDAPPQPVLEDA